MRIIAGSKRGLKLDTLSGEETRPTADRVKEALFSMLMPYLPEARVLDLFAGSGALGMESISRGAKKCDFVEISPKAAATVRKNLCRADFLEETEVFQTDYSSFLDRQESAYDIIFLDPPYRSGFYETALRKIAERNLLSKNGRIVVEWDQEKPSLSPFEEEKERRYGRIHLSILKGLESDE